MIMSAASAPEPPLLLRIEEAAERLMYRLVMSGAIESVPIGRLRRIPSECLSEYVDRLRAQSAHYEDHPDDAA